ncbi:MAG: DUF5058 family protein [Gemmiger sp.]|nr:DUF5058 family protein [Gemmiger sp.]
MAGVFNSWVLYALAALPVAGVAGLCRGLYRRGWRLALAAGVPEKALRATARTAAKDSLLPGLGGVLGVAVMAGYLGVPLAWLRFSLAGGLPYELAAATLTAGRQLARLSPQGYGAAAVISALGMLPGPVLCLTILPFYLKKAGRLHRKAPRPACPPQSKGWQAWLALAGVTLLTVACPLAMSRAVGGVPNAQTRQAMQGSLLGVVALYWPGALAEFLICAPLLGRQASGLCFLGGSLSNVRLPCVLAARGKTNTHAGTPAGEGVSAVAAAASTAASLGVTAVGAAVVAPFAPAIGALLRPFTGAVQVAVFALYALPAVKWGVDFIRRWRAGRARGRV